MSLPSQEVLDGIKDLISEITGFKEEDENFSICQRYCLSHVVHHTYPFLSKTTVINLVNSYVSRFYGHGYFRVSQELNNQVKSFLNNEKLFEKNPQYDIQWSLLSLLSSLSSNLTSVKELPELLPIDDEENKTEDFDWRAYLMNDLPEQVPLMSEDEDLSWEDEGEEDSSHEVDVKNITTETKEKLCQHKKDLEMIFDNKNVFDTENSSEIRRQRIEEFLKSRRSKRDLEVDFRLRGNITEKFDQLMHQEGIIKKSQLVSEYELMENILFQFQTGERIFLRKGLTNPALTSVTENTLGNYLGSLQPYFRIIRNFRDFDCEVTEARYSDNCLDESWSQLKQNQQSTASGSAASSKKNIPNVLFMYNVMLKKALEPFQKEVTEIVENLESHTLIQMEKKLQPHYHDLTSLFYVHNLAIKNWKTECNWMSSIRILCVLYNAIMDATSTRMSFLYLNFFLRCFKVYLDLIDSWISFLDLIDLNDEFIVAKSSHQDRLESKCSEYEIRPYKTDIENFEVKNIILDLISHKMIEVGQSLEVLRGLNRFATQGEETSKETFYKLLVKSINEKVQTLGKVHSVPKQLRPPEKQKSIFTMKNIGLGLKRDNGGGDSSEIGNLLMEILKEEEEKKAENSQSKQMEKTKKIDDYCGKKFIYSMVRNTFFKMSFDSIGLKQVERQLEKAKNRLKQDSSDEALMVIKTHELEILQRFRFAFRKPEEGKIGIYPLHKIVTEAFHKILVLRISGACALVKDIVLTEWDLPGHLSLLRSILLFNDSYLIQPFILALFTQPFIWGSSYSLSLHLKECVRNFQKDHGDGLSVVLTKNGPTKCENILQAIDAITVNYEVKWPLTLIITPEAMRKYNEIFRLALKLKWAHWALCGIHFQGKGEEEKGSKLTRHRLQLLRFWLLSTLGRINNYFLTQMTPPDMELSSCSDLKEIIQRHSEFLEKIYRNCLLGERSPEGKKLIQETLITLCMDVSLEEGNFDEVKLSAIEKKFANCHLLLSHLLSSLEK